MPTVYSVCRYSIYEKVTISYLTKSRVDLIRTVSKKQFVSVYLGGDIILLDAELTRASNRLSSGTIRLLTQKDISRIVSLKLFFVYLLYIHVNV